MMERGSECEERTVVQEAQVQRRSWAFPFQAFFRFCVVSRLPGDPLGPLRQIKGTPAAVSGDKPPGQDTHF